MLLSCILVCSGLLSASAQQPATTSAVPTAAKELAGPQIRFATPIHDFGKVKAGNLVKYTYFFTNSGDQVLEISRVQPSCGCTTAGEWTRLTRPGETGRIPVQFNSGNFNGQVFKTITVASNDRKTPTVVLQLKGIVWKPIELVPPYTLLTIPPDAPNATAVVRIINNMEEPLTVSDPVCNNKSFTADLKQTIPGKEYQLTLQGVPPFNAGNMQGKVTMKTSTPDMPTIEVNFWANIEPPIAIMPPQLMLPAGPLTVRATPTVMIQNNSTNALTLSDAAVNAPGVQVQLREIQPGRIYNASLVFPEGFSVQPGQQIVLTAKSNNPRVPLVRVPVMQMARPRSLAVAPPMRPASVQQATPVPLGQAGH